LLAKYQRNLKFDKDRQKKGDNNSGVTVAHVLKLAYGFIYMPRMMLRYAKVIMDEEQRALYLVMKQGRLVWTQTESWISLNHKASP
jgi:hypothetical protein